MGQIKHYNNGKWTIYTSGEDLSGYTGTTNTYYIGVNNTDGDLSKVNPDGELINLEKPNVGFTGFTYEIGEYVASEGGVIAHRWLSTSAGGSPTAGTVQNYLVIDTQDISNGAPWATLFSNISNVESKWNGQSNTNNLIAAGPAAGITPGTAAVGCDLSTRNGKSDWYLPAIDELNKVWDNRWEIAQGLEVPSIVQTLPGGTSIKDAYYWSSTEYDTNNAFIFNFYRAFDLGGSGGFIIHERKDSSTNPGKFVRAMRKFSI